MRIHDEANLPLCRNTKIFCIDAFRGECLLKYMQHDQLNISSMLSMILAFEA